MTAARTHLRATNPRRLLLLLTATTFFFAPILMRPTRAQETQTVHVFERTLTKPATYKYLLAVPEGYERRDERRWPLLLFLHGSGERGNDVWTIAKHGPPKLLRPQGGSARESAAGREQRRAAAKLLAENFIVVSPQCAKNQWWDTEALLALLDDVLARHRIDERRVYLTGLSMGGFGAWSLGLTHPERFAAIAPVCGGGDLAVAFHSNYQKRHPLRSLAVWAFHGARDETVPVTESERMVEILKRFQVEEVKLTVYPEAGHDSWTETYANPELYRWLLRQRRPAPAE